MIFRTIRVCKRTAYAAASFLFAALSFPSFSHALERFNNPTVDGIPMDGCLAWATHCEASAAEYFCSTKGYEWARDFGLNKNPQKTKTLLTKEECTNPPWLCGSFSYIECAKGYAASPEDSTSDRVVLLLHGLASSAATWDTLIGNSFDQNNLGAFGGNCVAISFYSDGHVEAPGKSVPTPDRHVYCYSLNFGYFDANPSGEKNVEGGVCDTTRCSGDYSAFYQLGQEVARAVDLIKTWRPNAKIILIAHSRGGLAARSYLQTTPSDHRIGALLTIGTPHQGSPLGRLWNYLHDNCVQFVNGVNVRRQDGGACQNDWSIADTLNALTGVASGLSHTLDVRAPGVRMLSPESNEILDLNDPTDLNQLPPEVIYSSVSFNGEELGRLIGFDVNALHWVEIDLVDGPGQLSQPAIDAVMRDQDKQRYTRQNSGDGIVPVTSQGMSLIPAWNRVHSNFMYSGTLHIQEPDKTTEIRQVLDQLYDRLGWLPNQGNMALR